MCGANHKTPPHQCRLCGATMDSTVEAMGGPVAVRARTTDQKKKGVGGVAVIGIITVAVIAIAPSRSDSPPVTSASAAFATASPSSRATRTDG
jgi:hypothetical protein